MAKRNKDAVAKVGLPKANAYSVLTVILTLGLIILAVIAILGLPYFTYSIVNVSTKDAFSYQYLLANGSKVSILANDLSVNFADLIEFTYFYPVAKLSEPIAYLLSPNMDALYNLILVNISPDWLSITMCALLIAGAVFEVLFIIFGFVILGTTVCAFKKGNFKKLRTSTRSTGIMVAITFLPAVILNILFAFVKGGEVGVTMNTLIPFILVIVGIIVEAINGSSYSRHLKNAVCEESVNVVEVKEEPACECQECAEQPHVEEATDAPLEEIKEDGSYKVCPNCGAHAHLEDRFCEECGQALDDAIIVKNENINDDACSCCCGCCSSEENTPTDEVKEEIVEETKPEEVKVEEPELEETKIAENEDVKVVVVGENGTKVIDRNAEVGTRRVIKVIGLPVNLQELSDHRFAKNGQLQVARIPSNITELGVGCFANCYNLEEVRIPLSVKKICANALFACSKLRKISYEGTIAQFKKIERQTNWLTSAGTNIISCSDGDIMIQ